MPAQGPRSDRSRQPSVLTDLLDLIATGPQQALHKVEVGRTASDPSSDYLTPRSTSRTESQSGSCAAVILTVIGGVDSKYCFRAAWCLEGFPT